MRRAFFNKPKYRQWFFDFCSWSHNVHRRKYAKSDAENWGDDIAALLAQSESLYPIKWCSQCNHSLVHIPSGLIVRGPLLCWGMYGLERFGDYLMKMSKSRHKNKHVSICEAYIWVEMTTFLMVHDPAKYKISDYAPNSQPHLFSFSNVSSPKSWSVEGRASTSINLPDDYLTAIASLYSAQPKLNVVANGPIGRMVLQVLGKIWCGVRYFQMYYEGYDHAILGRGHCCVSWSGGHDASRWPGAPSFGGQYYGIIRHCFEHHAYHSIHCPSVLFFYVEVLCVTEAQTDVPLMEAEATGSCVWLSELDLMEFAQYMFVLRNFDEPRTNFLCDHGKFYVIELN